MENITINLENLSDDEREQLMKLIKKANNADKPTIGEHYYYIVESGYIAEVSYEDLECEKDALLIGNHFTTREEAEFEVERLKVITEIKRIAAKDDEVKWDGKNLHWFLCYDYSMCEISYMNCLYEKDNNIFFASKERAKECIETVGEDRIKIYYLGVKE